jgi:hypothetical protein
MNNTCLSSVNDATFVEKHVRKKTMYVHTGVSDLPYQDQ